jgi:MFS family permease
MFDSHFPVGSVYYFDINFLELAGSIIFGPVVGWLSDSLRIRFRRRGLSLIALLFFGVGFAFQLAYRSPLDDESQWSRNTMVPAFLFVQVGVTFLQIASRSILTDFGFQEGQAHVHAVASAMECAGDVVVYGVVRFFVRNAPTAAELWGWSSTHLRNVQIGLAAGSGLAVIASMLSGEQGLEGGGWSRWTALFNVDDCPCFWRLAIPYGLASYAYHQEQLVTPAIFHLYLGGAIEGYHDGFWLGCVALMISAGVGVLSGALSQVCAISNSLRTGFAFTQTLSGVLLAAFSFSCWGPVSLSSVYSLTGIGLGFLRAVPYALLGEHVKKEQVGRCVSLMVCFGMLSEQVVQGDFFNNFMDVYYPWLHVWGCLGIAGFLASRFPTSEVQIETRAQPSETTASMSRERV